MLYRSLGSSGLAVSRIAAGALNVGPLQLNLDVASGAEIIAAALLRGVNFVDTAQIYKSYPYIRLAMETTGIRPVVCSKSYAYTAADMRGSLEEALDQLAVPAMGVFMLHEQESELTLKGHREALDFLVQAREKGWIRATGLSTHSIRGVLAGIRSPNIDVIHAIFNRRGLGVMDGSREQMLAALRYARAAGKGVYVMKVFGGGNLYQEARASLDYVMKFPFIDSAAIGMGSVEEVELNLEWVHGRHDPGLEMRTKRQRRLHIESWCTGCGSCVEHCRYGALELVDDKVRVDAEKCLLCGYCAAFCPDFSVKIV